MPDPTMIRDRAEAVLPADIDPELRRRMLDLADALDCAKPALENLAEASRALNEATRVVSGIGLTVVARLAAVQRRFVERPTPDAADAWSLLGQLAAPLSAEAGRLAGAARASETAWREARGDG